MNAPECRNFPRFRRFPHLQGAYLAALGKHQNHQKIRAFRFYEVLREAIFCQAKENVAVIYQYNKIFSCRMAKKGSLKTEFNLFCLG